MGLGHRGAAPAVGPAVARFDGRGGRQHRVNQHRAAGARKAISRPGPALLVGGRAADAGPWPPGQGLAIERRRIADFLAGAGTGARRLVRPVTGGWLGADRSPRPLAPWPANPTGHQMAERFAAARNRCRASDRPQARRHPDRDRANWQATRRCGRRGPEPGRPACGRAELGLWMRAGAGPRPERCDGVGTGGGAAGAGLARLRAGGFRTAAPALCRARPVGRPRRHHHLARFATRRGRRR